MGTSNAFTTGAKLTADALNFRRVRWASVNVTAGTADQSGDITSITDVGAGEASIVWTTDWDNANYCVTLTAQFTAAGTEASTRISQVRDSDKAVGLTTIYAIRPDTGAGIDPVLYLILAQGDPG